MTMWIMIVLALLLAGPLLTLAFGKVAVRGDWRTATHRAAGLAPDPAAHRDAVVQVYASRTFGWRGAFADHTWIAVKPAGAARYTRYEVIGWYGGGGRSVISESSQRSPDAEWYGAPPRLLRDLRGPDAQAVLDRMPQAVATYPYGSEYRVWPGPNSNTFVAHVGRAVPELRLDLPPTAIGKDFLGGAALAGLSPSGTGVQVSVLGLLGILAAWEEGVEVNLLGLSFGVDVKDAALKVPIAGRLGWR